ncbi:5c8a4369-b896-4e6c-b317-932d620d29da [Thermothielavioides terrestris]|uniref:5c8a4369-b896-4e6c-b317-932d620d29da n=1 Tax=Thermothielavioides terrestris TaxID=2587410 RepID=A0A3S4BR01_9PEZI|nr:5c8a4369-b896-4e6c-b317-932d620d29da [Thermothielavioides terrestris]
MTSVDNAVAKIEAVSTEPDRPASADARIPEPLFNDLCSCVIPMLVLVLQSAFAIGVKKPDAEAGNPLPEEGVFTVATAEILQWVLEWLSNLGELLKDEVSDADQRPDPDSPAHDRDDFCCVLDVVKSRVRLAVDNFNEEEREVEEMKRKDMEIKEAKRREEEEQLAAATWQDRLFSSSIRSILDQPRPFELLWRKFNPSWSGDAAHSSQRTTTTTPSTTTNTTTPARQRSVTTGAGTGTGTGTRSGTSASASARPPPSPPRPVADAPSPSPPPRNYPPWDEEDTAWFLQQLVRPDRRSGYLHVCAETLQRDVDDLLAEKERLKRQGRYRSPEWRR